MYVLLLTACINPDGMLLTKLSDKEIRLQQYKKALDFYLATTTFPIIFAENSNTDISNDYQSYINTGRLEILTFAGNKNKAKGKGYGEACIIEYAINHSKILSSNFQIVKITGRLIIKNITKVLSQRFPLQKKDCVICSFNSNLTFPDSRFFIAPFSFFKYFISNKEEIDDSNNVFFEHILAKNIIKNNIPYAPFWHEPIIIGVSGTTGLEYKRPDDSYARSIDYKKEALLRVHLFYKKNRGKNVARRIFYSFLYNTYLLIYKVITKCQI